MGLKVYLNEGTIFSHTTIRENFLIVNYSQDQLPEPVLITNQKAVGKNGEVHFEDGYYKHLYIKSGKNKIHVGQVAPSSNQDFLQMIIAFETKLKETQLRKVYEVNAKEFYKLIIKTKENEFTKDKMFIFDTENNLFIDVNDYFIFAYKTGKVLHDKFVIIPSFKNFQEIFKQIYNKTIKNGSNPQMEIHVATNLPQPDPYMNQITSDYLVMKVKGDDNTYICYPLYSPDKNNRKMYDITQAIIKALMKDDIELTEITIPKEFHTIVDIILNDDEKQEGFITIMPDKFEVEFHKYWLEVNVNSKIKNEVLLYNLDSFQLSELKKILSTLGLQKQTDNRVYLFKLILAETRDLSIIGIKDENVLKIHTIGGGSILEGTTTISIDI